jgi:uncharacterized protein Smg (DUF494 family)
MKERVVEILVYLMAEIDANKRLSEINLEDLTERGYTQSEISAAFSWLYDNLLVHDGFVEHGSLPSKDSRRVFHEAEKLMMTTDAQGYLMQLFEIGLLDNRDLESIIERAMMSGFEKLSLEDVQEIAAGVLLAKHNAWKESRSTLNENGTIH